jgi:glycerate-2-kinase
MIINFKDLARSPLREKALLIAEAGYGAIEIESTVERRVKIENEILKIRYPGSERNEAEVDLKDFKRIFLVGLGKGSGLACSALAKILDKRLSRGIALDVNKLTTNNQQLTTLIGTHPLPSSANVFATQEIIKLAKSLTKNDLLLIFIGGGGSALGCASDKERDASIFVIKELTMAGADIFELNTVRKHLSEFKGGGLTKIAHPARVIVLIASDVLGDDLSMISSGPTVFDKTTKTDAERVLKKYGLNPFDFRLIETPKDEEYFTRVSNILFACSQDAAVGMVKKTQELGFKGRIYSLKIKGEAKNSLLPLMEAAESGEVVIAAGETTVTLETSDIRHQKLGKPFDAAQGKGGRNMEAVLGALAQLTTNDRRLTTDMVFMSFASDGRDNTEAAGAIADCLTIERIRELKLRPEKFLDSHDTFRFFEKTGDLIFAEAKSFNVADLMLVLRDLK